MKHVFIVGSKGIPAAYGGFETFVEKLTENQFNAEIKYHVACAVDDMPKDSEYEHNGAHCFCIKWRPIGAARAVAYDLDSLNWCLNYIKQNDIEGPIIYVLACRIGPFIRGYARQIHELGGMLLVNPDGHEWKRAKWTAPIRKYWKLSEQGMVKHADLLVCDSKNIEQYIQEEYKSYQPKTIYIAYGADTSKSILSDDNPDWQTWLNKNGLEANSYYLVVGRFVPENNFETMIREFMASSTERAFALVTGVNDAFLDQLQIKTGYRADSRIKFVGTVYNQELLKKIRENAYAYLHGHEVGGTNPSLLEALSLTQVNMLLDVGFNREVAEDSALYWTKDEGNLAEQICRVEAMDESDRRTFSDKAKAVIESRFTWAEIVSSYEDVFCKLD